MSGWAGVFFLLVLGASRLAAENPVMLLPLQADRVTRVPTHPAVALLVEFPLQIADYAGRGFTEEVGSVAGDFLLRWGAGDSYLVVVPLVEGARATLHVVLAGHSYPLELFPAGAEQAWAKLVFSLPTLAANPAAPAGRMEARRMPMGMRAEKPPSADPRQWLDAVELLRSLLNRPNGQVEAVLRADPAVSLSTKGFEQRVGDCDLACRAVMRREDSDVVVFALTLRNPTQRRILFATDTLFVRCGERLYPVQITDWPPELGASESAEVMLAIAGDGMGARNRLSVHNTFRISLAEADPRKPQPRPTP